MLISKIGRNRRALNRGFFFDLPTYLCLWRSLVFSIFVVYLLSFSLPTQASDASSNSVSGRVSDSVSGSAPGGAQAGSSLVERSNSIAQVARLEKTEGSGPCATRSWRLIGTDPWEQKDGFNVVFEESGPASNRVVIILPPTGGLSVLDRRLARLHCERGVRTIAMAGFDGLDDTSTDWKLHDRGFLRGLTAIRWAMRWVESRPGAGRETRYGIFGASLGGLQAALVASHEARVDRLALVAAGAPLARVVATSEHEAVARLREPRWREAGIEDVAAYEERLNKEIELDWGRFVPASNERSNERSDLVFVSLSDTVVPTDTQAELAKRLGNPKKIEFWTGHFWTIVRAQLLYGGEIVNHLVSDLP